jgi:diguanylate cyclase (GGDEF)-like protein/PAS domain S-box-containing protein
MMAKPGRPSFPLLRYFALLSLGCMLLVAIPMGYVLHRYSQSALERIAEERNVGYAELLDNSLWPEYRSFFLAASPLDDAALRGAPAAAELRARIAQHARDTQILKVKIYDLSGRTVFSTDPSQVGQMQPGNAGVLAAIAGRVASTLTHRNAFDAFDGVVTDRDVLSSYIPVRAADGRPEAVFEIYTDVTAFLAQMSAMRNAVAGTVGVSVALLYLLLSVLIWRAGRIIARQREALAEVNRTLEARVDERTVELSNAVALLRSEIADRERAESDLKLAATVFENSGEGVLIASRDHKIIAVNRAFSKITGYAAEEVLGRNPSILKSGRQTDSFYMSFWESISERGTWSGEIWNRRKDGEVYPEWLSVSAVRDDHGELTHYVAVFSDISDVKASQDRLEFLAHHDPLTGLPNRVQLGRQLSATIAESREKHVGFSLLFIDLDQFKHVNDTLGHSLGDQLLRAVGEAFDACLEGEAMVARVGGDEFVAILTMPGRAAEESARVVIGALSEPFLIDEHMLYVGASIGIVRYPEHGETAEALLAHADAAMYRAKASGRNTYCVYGPEMTERARDRLALAALLRQALDEGKLFLQFQPQIDIATGRLAGVESLVRIRDPELGVIGPTQFIELAEEDGTIGRLGQWVLAESCRTMARWRAAGVAVPKIAVNVSVSQLDRGDLPGELARLLAETGLSADSVEIEITESVIMNAGHSIEKLNTLREMGITLAIDDFGTGYSSLSYLRRLPVQKLKIDGSFLAELALQGDADAVVRGIVGLAQSLGLTTVAEGVETADQLTFLHDMGCNVAQGYLFGLPLDEGAVAGFLAARAPVDHEILRLAV